MNTETKKLNFQDWTETEVEMFIDELKKYHNPDNQPIFYIYERHVSWGSKLITVSIPKTPKVPGQSFDDLKVIWKAELIVSDDWQGFEPFYQVCEISVFRKIIESIKVGIFHSTKIIELRPSNVQRAVK